VLLNDKCEIAFVELVEPVVPTHLFQGVGSAIAGEIQADHANIVAAPGTSHAGWFCSALLRPILDFIVIGKNLG
jgi:hypothetical protein